MIRKIGFLSAKKPKIRGLIKLSIKDTMPDRGIEQLTFKDVTTMINQGLQTRLENLNVPDNKKIVKDLNKFFLMNQSLITLSRV